ncbi:Palmitoyltransferase PFA3 [Termitomyces sp. J132]|nr:Palmitoyltransferase PFA3 [Termitomyces sp. J132]
MVGFTSAMMVYSAYVFIGRFCVDMIRRRENAGGTRGTGIALLIVFVILWLWMVWAYAKVVFTSPGYARDYVSKSNRPMFPEPPIPFIPYDNIVENSRSPARPLHSTGPLRDMDQESIGGPSYENLPVRQPVDISKPAMVNNVARAETNEQDSRNSSPRKPELVYTRHENPADYLHRRPLMTPILRPEYRYCEVDRIVKPYRTHHCRSCGTCILKYDHHCPWIGQCVGARNQKFFMNFIQVTSFLTTYTCVTLLVFVVLRATSADGHIDPQKIVIVAFAGLFAVFTTLMQFTHVRLIWSGQTTVESMQGHRMKHREKQAMNDVIGYWAILAKRRKTRSYDEEWGRIGREGNIWWLGSGKKGWVDVMGYNVWGWFLPIGKSLNDGLTYPVNPRFDAQGIWRKRAEWPRELR